MFYPNNVRRYQANKQPEFYTTSFISIPSLYCNCRLIDSSLHQKCYPARKKQMLRLSRMTWSRIVLMAMIISLFLSVQSDMVELKSESGESYQYNESNELHKGKNSQVYKGINRYSKNTVAIKKINSNETKLSEIELEVDFMKRLQDHENILTFVDFIPDKTGEGFSYIISQFCENELFDALETLDITTIKEILKQITAGLEHIHDKDIVHNDLKVNNILLQPHNTVKITDFGTSFDSNTGKKGLFGTPEYMAPEESEGSGNWQSSKASDIWSLGVIFYVSLCQKMPFAPKNTGKIKSYDRELEYLIKHSQFDWNCKSKFKVPPEAKDLIEKMLKKNPKERLKIKEVLNYGWFNDHKEETNQKEIKDFQLYDIVHSIEECNYYESYFGFFETTISIKKYNKFQIKKRAAMFKLKNIKTEEEINFPKDMMDDCFEIYNDDKEFKLGDIVEANAKFKNDNVKISQLKPGEKFHIKTITSTEGTKEYTLKSIRTREMINVPSDAMKTCFTINVFRKGRRIEITKTFQVENATMELGKRYEIKDVTRTKPSVSPIKRGKYNITVTKDGNDIVIRKKDLINLKLIP